MGARLVRHRIGDLEWKHPDAKAALRPVRDRAEHVALLRQKLLEECGELIVASEPSRITEELADVLEVLCGYAAVSGIAWEVVESACVAKLQARGGFTEGVVWDV